MQDIGDIKRLLAERGLRPNKRFGQNFLHEPARVQALVDAAGVADGAAAGRAGEDGRESGGAAGATSDEVVLEVGPGTGALTECLLEAGATVIACELDRALADLIEDHVLPKADGRLTLVRGDCLGRGRRLSDDVVAAIDGRPFRLVANLPYQAASPLMIELLLHHPNCRGQWVTIQKEVADRLTADPGPGDYGPLGIIAQALARVRRLAVLPPGCFWPAPKVTSAMAELLPRGAGDRHAALDAPAAFARFVTGLFSKRRKQLGSILGRDRAWPDGIDPTQRPETLPVDRLVDLWVVAGEPHDEPPPAD